MKKKIISLLLAACMLVGLVPVGQVRANAADETATSGTCGENLTWTFDEDGTLTISGTGEMDDYTYSDTFTYDSNSPWHSLTIKTVVLTDGVTNIGNYAFYRCKSLSSVSIPDSVTTIGGSAFYDCNSLTSISIPNSVTSIGWGAFIYCKSLTNISIPDCVTTIEDSAFYYCKSLTSISIPNSVTTIKDRTFAGCESLTSVSIPNSVTTIESGAFVSCGSLTDVYYGGSEDEWNRITVGGYNTSLLNATIHYNSYLGDDFQANRDGNSFLHSDGKGADGIYYIYPEGSAPGFYRVENYNINDTNVYNRLTNGLESGEQSLIKSKMVQNWGGSCYGIAVSMKLVYDKILNLNSIKQTNHTANCYYELPKPYEDSIFLNTIQYYQLSQYRSDSAEDSVYTSSTNNLKLIIEKLKEGSPLVLSYGYNIDSKHSGHSILALSYQKNNNGYMVKLFDENRSKFCEMTIAKDYSTFNFTDGNGHSISQENCTYMSIQTSSQIYNVVPYDVTLQQSSTNTSRQLESASTSAFILVSMNTDCTISNSKGQQLILKDGEISTDSTMHVINYHVIIESENPQWYIEVPDNEQFFITEATDNIQVGIYNKNYFLSFESDGFVQDDTLVYTIGSGINVQKSDDSAYNFTAYVSSEYSVALKAPVRWAGNQLSGQRKSVPRCGGATVPELETSIPEQQNRIVTLCYSLMAGSSPYTSLMDR